MASSRGLVKHQSSKGEGAVEVDEDGGSDRKKPKTLSDRKIQKISKHIIQFLQADMQLETLRHS
jgi:hypothetical protein